MTEFEKIKKAEDIKAYIKYADDSLAALGYTEHGPAHVGKVSDTAARILEELDYDGHTVELARIAGYLHDIGNLVNRVDHSQSGALMAFRILDKMKFPPEDIARIATAIGNHDEGTGTPVSPVAAALILADKSDVRRSRVRNPDTLAFDIHDRVNYSVESADISVCRDRGEIELKLVIDTSISPVMAYFEIFLERMIMCRKAAEALEMTFKLVINGQHLM